MTNAIRTAPPPPPAAPAIIATLLCDELLDGLPDGLLELLDGLLEPDVGEAVDVDDIPIVDDGELAFRQEELLDPKTCWNPETPPCLPVESVTKYRRFVPWFTFTTEVKMSLFE